MGSVYNLKLPFFPLATHGQISQYFDILGPHALVINIKRYNSLCNKREMRFYLATRRRRKIQRRVFSTKPILVCLHQPALRARPLRQMFVEPLHLWFCSPSMIDSIFNVDIKYYVAFKSYFVNRKPIFNIDVYCLSMFIISPSRNQFSNSRWRLLTTVFIHKIQIQTLQVMYVSFEQTLVEVRPTMATIRCSYFKGSIKRCIF